MYMRFQQGFAVGHPYSTMIDGSTPAILRASDSDDPEGPDALSRDSVFDADIPAVPEVDPQESDPTLSLFDSEESDSITESDTDTMESDTDDDDIADVV
jgi:hypothetical protein